MRRRDFLGALAGAAAASACPAPAGSTECAPAEMGFWTEQRALLRKLLDSGDRERFLTWPPIVETMFYSPPPEELQWLQALPNWPSIRALIRDPGVGGAAPDPVLHSNGNIIHHAYSMFRFENAIGRELSGDGSILEIGGGYGNFCRLVLQRGFAGRYVMYDLPEFLELQEWYLARTLAAAQQRQLSFTTAVPASAEFVVGLWSISEMPFALRDCIKAIRPRYFLVGYQSEFFGLDNVAYFSRWTLDETYRWVHVAIPHIKDNHYLFGAAR